MLLLQMLIHLIIEGPKLNCWKDFFLIKAHSTVPNLKT